jgi:hypothetical protein
MVYIRKLDSKRSMQLGLSCGRRIKVIMTNDSVYMYPCLCNNMQRARLGKIRVLTYIYFFFPSSMHGCPNRRTTETGQFQKPGLKTPKVKQYGRGGIPWIEWERVNPELRTPAASLAVGICTQSRARVRLKRRVASFAVSPNSQRK